MWLSPRLRAPATRPGVRVHGARHVLVGLDDPVPESPDVDGRGDEGVPLVSRRAEVGDGHARRPAADGLDLHPGGKAAQQAVVGHVGHRAHVVHGGVGHDRLEHRVVLPVPGPAGPGGQRILVRCVVLEAGQQQFAGQRAQAPHPVPHRRGRPRLQGHVQPHHGDRPARVEDDGGRLGVNGHVELGRGRGVAPAGRAAHDHKVLDLVDQLRFPVNGQRDIGQRAGGDQGDLTRGGADRLDQEINGVSARGPCFRGRQPRTAETGIPVHVPGVERRPQQRCGAARGDRDARGAHELTDPLRVGRGEIEAHVAGHGGDAAQIKVRAAHREGDGQRVVDAWIAVQNDLLSHPGPFPAMPAGTPCDVPVQPACSRSSHATGAVNQRARVRDRVPAYDGTRTTCRCRGGLAVRPTSSEGYPGGHARGSPRAVSARSTCRPSAPG